MPTCWNAPGTVYYCILEPLHQYDSHVCRYGEDDNVNILLGAGTPVDFQDEGGSTALHKAAANGTAVLFTVITSADWLAFMLVAGHSSIIHILIKAGWWSYCGLLKHHRLEIVSMLRHSLRY